MRRIRQLDPHVVNQIAAGEVVERPASVVKELVENALDAGARHVDVRVRDGGKALIEVADDGWGMDSGDLAVAFGSHTTSKIEAAEDLRHIGTMGFRGEALASIGSVARAAIVSRPPEDDAGHRIQDFDGEIGPVEPAAASPGTVVRVENLFARLPARRKFLRTAATELGHIKTLMGRFALAFPHVGFRLRNDKQVLLETAPDEDRHTRIERVHGPDVARGLLHAAEKHGEPLLEAWIGPPTMTRGDSKLEQVFLNGRFIRDRTVAHAIREAYRDLVPPGGRRPVVFLFLSCDPREVDVNVHPGKAEVRWRDGQAVHRVVRTTLRRALEAAAPGASVTLPGGDRHASREAAVEHAFQRPPAATHATGWLPPAPAPSHDTVREHPPAEAPADEPKGMAGGLRPLAQALGTYLVLEDGDSIVLVDQHALHERVLFDEINDRLREKGQLEVQRLLVPLVVHLEPADVARLFEAQALLQSLGWVIEPFGDDAVAVQGVPAILRRPDPEAALEELLSVFEQGSRDGLDRTHLLEAAVDRMACRAAVMAGDALHEDEVLALLKRAEALNHSHSCPHGRPTRLTLERSHLERWFHRTV